MALIRPYLKAVRSGWCNHNHAIRTIKGGAVRIRGVTFRPRPPYAGELDGLRMAFSLYYIGREWNCEFVALWGTEKAYHSDSPDTDWPGPNCIDGTFHWEWWDAIPDPGKD